METTFYDTIAPLVNILGGVAGLTILYFIIMVLQNRKKLRELEAIKERTIEVERMTRDLWMDRIRKR